MAAAQVHWLGFATQTPKQRFSQDELFQLAKYEDCSPADRRKFQALFRAAGVKTRAMYLTREQYQPTQNADEFHIRYVAGVRELAPLVAREALQRAGVRVGELDFLVFVSCTGYTCPGFSAELAHTLGMREDRPTANLLGMGCSALVPGLELLWSHLAARPGSRGMVVATEICSSTYWIDQDLETVIGNALFGDGAAAIVLSSSEIDSGRKLKEGKTIGEIEGFRTLRDGRYFSDMGFTQKDGRLRVRLAREIPERILPLFLSVMNSLELEPGARVAVHPGGRKILDLVEGRLVAQAAQWKEPLDWSRHILRELGNMSSPTVAFVLEQSFQARPLNATAGVEEAGALVTMGPGLSVEAVRIRWKHGQKE
jgi:predicted naringenin-chalcone synthase